MRADEVCVALGTFVRAVSKMSLHMRTNVLLPCRQMCAAFPHAAPVLGIRCCRVSDICVDLFLRYTRVSHDSLVEKIWTVLAFRWAFCRALALLWRSGRCTETRGMAHSRVQIMHAGFREEQAPCGPHGRGQRNRTVISGMPSLSVIDRRTAVISLVHGRVKAWKGGSVGGRRGKLSEAGRAGVEIRCWRIHALAGSKAILGWYIQRSWCSASMDGLRCDGKSCERLFLKLGDHKSASLPYRSCFTGVAGSWLM